MILKFKTIHPQCLSQTRNSLFINTQVELLKDQMEEVEEQASLVTKELREKNRDYELLKRSHAETQRAVQLLQVIFMWGNLIYFKFKDPIISDI